ncbi:hypothetical protein MSG28_006694 [Choristoneura fumiferana]|uniref:Uncharacterized protein n=1 Tax=Choristoneura fumiferana TaxID=7141 RepID=A0ACC0JKS7_CHOFU|nr:hypothetical protein MSG28_006694 [Choristoneura fumiferana]
MTEEYFPRGGKKPNVTYFKQSSNFLGAAEKGQGKKKKQKKRTENDDGYLSDEAVKDVDQSYKMCAVSIGHKTLKPGVNILGRVARTMETKLVVSLPSKLRGSVMACHISEPYNKVLEAYVNDEREQVRELPAMFRPGQYVALQVLESGTEPLDNGIEGHVFSDTTAYIQRFHADNVKGKKPALGQKIRAHVLYVMPTRNAPFLTMKNIFETSVPDLETEMKFKEGDIIDEAQVLKITGRSIHFKLGRKCVGTMSLKRVAVDEDLSDEQIIAKSYPIGSTHRVRVLIYNLSDYVYHVSDESSVLEERYFSLEALRPGQLVAGRVLSVADTQEGQEVTARVLTVDPFRLRLHLTLKPTLLSPELVALAAYEEAEVGKAYTGVVKFIKDFLLVSFFGDVVAYVPRGEVARPPPDNLRDAFHLGQIVSCTILHVDPEKKRMLGTLVTPPFWPAKRRDELTKRRKGTDDNEAPKKKLKTEHNTADTEVKNKKKDKKSKNKIDDDADEGKGRVNEVSEESDAIETDIHEDSDQALTPGDKALIDLSDCSRSKEWKKRIAALQTSIKCRLKRIEKINKKILSLEESGLTAKNKKYHTAMHQDKLSVEERMKKLEDALKTALEQLRKIDPEYVKKMKKAEKQKLKAESKKTLKKAEGETIDKEKVKEIVQKKKKKKLKEAAKIEENAEKEVKESPKKDKENKRKVKKGEEVKEVVDKSKDIKVVESLEPALEMPSAKEFWSENADNLAKTAKEDTSSSSEDEETEAPKKKRKKLSAAEKVAKARAEEERLRELERRAASSDAEPRSSDQFERALLASPNCSQLWIAYMAFHLQELSALVDLMLRKYKRDPRNYTLCGAACYRLGLLDKARHVMQKAVAVLEKKELSLLEYDRRFEVHAPDFIFYDYNTPDKLPPDSLHSYDLVVADPPFLSEECITKTSETIKLLAKDKIVVCTGAVMKEHVEKLLELKLCEFQPHHRNNLANEFCCYANFDLDGVLRIPRHFKIWLSIFTGDILQAAVSSVEDHGYVMDIGPLDNGIEGHVFSDTTAYIQRFHADNVKGKKPALGQKIRAHVLYVMPTRNAPFLTMKNIFETSVPDLETEMKFKEGDIIDEAQVLKITGRSIHFKLGRKCVGTMSIKRVAVDEDLSDEQIIAKSYPIDYVYHVSDESSVLEDATSAWKRCGPASWWRDACSASPIRRLRLHLTLKPTLLSPELVALAAYEEAEVGKAYTGVVKFIKDFLLVNFFGDVVAYVPRGEVARPPPDNLRDACTILHVDPEKKRMLGTLVTPPFWPAKRRDELTKRKKGTDDNEAPKKKLKTEHNTADTEVKNKKKDKKSKNKSDDDVDEGKGRVNEVSEESDAIETDIHEDGDQALTPGDKALIDLSDCSRSKEWKKRIAALQTSIKCRLKRIEKINKKILSLEESGLTAKNKKYHTAMHQDKLSVEERMKKLEDALKTALEQLRKIDPEYVKKMKKAEKQKLKAESKKTLKKAEGETIDKEKVKEIIQKKKKNKLKEAAKIEENAEKEVKESPKKDKENKRKVKKGEEVKEVVDKSKDIKVVESLEPALEMPSAKEFWSENADNLAKTAKEDTSSSSEDEETEAPKKKRKKLSAAEKVAKARAEEERLRELERRAASSDAEPRSSDQFERALLASPNCSQLWIAYMAFHLQEKLNVWLALLNLENRFGTKDPRNYTLCGAACYRLGLRDKARHVMQKAVAVLEKKELSLLEYDRRFEVHAPDFIFYDYNTPDKLPPDSLHSYDLVVADPPFLSEECITKTSETIKLLAKDKIVVCTGAVMKEHVEKLLELKLCEFQPHHRNNLANEFCCYANFDLDGVLRFEFYKLSKKTLLYCNN